MQHPLNRPDRHPVFTIESLENRHLLSAALPSAHADHSAALRARAAATVLPLAGTFEGTVRLSGGRSALGSGPAVRAISVTFSSSGNTGTLSGTVSVAGLGNLPFTGAADGNHVLLLLTGTSGASGELSGTLAKRGQLLNGQFVENTTGHSLHGSAHLHAGGSPVSVGATDLPAAPGTRVGRPVLSGTYTGTSTVGSTTANTALAIASETSNGTVTGSFSVGTQIFALSGTIVASRLDFLLSGSATGDGSATLSFDSHTLQGSFAEQTTGGIVRGQFTITNTPATTATQTTTGGTSTTPASGTTVGTPSGFSGIGGFTGGLTTPISGSGSAVSGTGATGTIFNSPVTGTAGALTPVTGTTSTTGFGSTGSLAGTNPITGTPAGTAFIGNTSGFAPGTSSAVGTTFTSGGTTSGVLVFPGEPGVTF